MGRPQALLAALIGAAAMACSASQSPVEQAAGSGTGIYPQGRLALQGDPGGVLATIGGEPALTIAEFNDRLFEFPVGDEGQDVITARKQVVDEMINVKFIVREAMRRHPGEYATSAGGASYQVERALAQSVIKTTVANPLLISDQEARAYYAENKDKFRQMDTSGAEEEQRILHIKFTMLSDRFQATVTSWRSQQTVEIALPLLKE